ncbi:S1 family peptidase [Sphingobacterium daejeonense]|uniref:S1 family peptidase n=1 Tax=Sphingobacterium daejeonense TaxID=371142 RepID=UPI0010C586B2|nr:serine protease [Sphingobacterium daejeonense]VTP87944.1 V8-like Glu-specific endopeptidase [Sphingobacterium daejeonense]
MRSTLLLIFPFLIVSCSYGQEYIDEEALFMKLVNQVRSPDFKLEELTKVYETVHLDKKNKIVDVKTISPRKKKLSKKEVFKTNKANVYRFVKIFLNENTGARTIDNAATAFPISEDGYFCVNHHMVDIWNAGSGDPEAVDRSVYYFLADFEGNILPIDSVCSYNEQADVAIIKANTKGKKIEAFPLGNELETGDDVFIIAHPKSYLYYFSAGIVNRMTQNKDNIFSRKMEISADFAAGSSGGPIFDEFGNIAGIVSLTQSLYYHQQKQQSLQMVVRQTAPVSVIKALIKK